MATNQSKVSVKLEPESETVECPEGLHVKSEYPDNDAEFVVKEEIEIGCHVLQPPDISFMLMDVKEEKGADNIDRPVQRTKGYPQAKRRLLDPPSEGGNSSGCPPAKRRLLERPSEGGDSSVRASAPASAGAPASGPVFGSPHGPKVSSRVMQPAMAMAGGRDFADPNHGVLVEQTPRGRRVRIARATITDLFWTEEETEELRRNEKQREKQAAVGLFPGMSNILASIRRASTTDYATQDRVGRHCTEIERWLDGQSASTVDEGVAVYQESAGPSPSPTVVAESRADNDLRNQVGTSSASFAVPVSVPVPVDTGSDVDDIEDDEHLLLLPRRVNTALALALPDPEQDPEVEALLNNMAVEQDAADDEILDETNDTYDWTSDYTAYRGVQELFTVPATGPTIPDETPYGNFCKTWDRPIMTYIADMTNLYAEQKAAETYETEKLTKGARINSWTPTDVDELYVYFAILMFMAIDPRGSLKEYWITDNALELPKFRKLMTYDRFLLLNSMLHFVDNTTDLTSDGDPKVAKLQPIIDYCNNKFQSCYVLDQKIAIDESLTLWKGHLSWVQNIMSKAARFGIKTYELCESSTGYLWRFFIYTGKHCNVGDIGDNSTGLCGKTSAIVLHLMTDLTHKGYCLTMDSFYNSPALARHLKSLKTDCVGTLRVARKNVPEAIKCLKKKTMARGEMVAQHCGDISLLAWNDAKLVTTISTFHNAETYLGRRGGKPQTKPIVIKDYNSAMGGIDLKDQKLSMYQLERKCGLKWYIKMFRRLMNASILNAFIMYRRTILNAGRVSLSHRDFRYALAEELVKRHSSPRIIPRSLSANRYDGFEHYTFLIKVPCAQCSIQEQDDCNQCKTVRRRCARCTKLGRRTTTRYECKKCAKALCIGRCFQDYHTLEKN